MDYEEKTGIFESIKNFFKSIVRWFRHFFEQTYNLITWFPTIATDQQWDSDWFFIVMRKKLERMESFQRSKYAFHLNALDDANSIHYCIERLDRIIEHEYLEKALLPFYEKFPDYVWDLSRHMIDQENGTMLWENQDTPEQKELFSTCCKQADLDEENDLDELFAHLRLYVKDWWD